MEAGLLQDAAQARVGRDAGNAAPLGDGLAVDLVQVGREVDGPGAGDVAADAVAVDGRADLPYLADAVGGHAAADEDAYPRETRQVQVGPHLFHEVRGDAAPLAGGVEADPVQLLA